RNPDLRKQTTLHHQHSVCMAIIPVLFNLKKKYCPKLDTELMKDAFQLHDLPEGLLLQKKDISVVSKRAHHDLEEYVAFEQKIQHFKGSDPDLYEHFLEAYLLQFAHKEDEYLSIFPEDAMDIIANLRGEHPYEVALFPALEKWEYLFYAYEGYLHHGDEVIWVNILRHHSIELSNFSSNILGFREEVFPIHFEEAINKFIEKNKHVIAF
ncbi:MAG: hypothetical protein RL687_459, partial [Candidatus Parcubacteria bacterium]